MGKHAFSVIRLPGSLWDRLPNLFHLLKIFGILLIFCLLAFTSSTAASAPAAPLSLRPIQLQISCSDFWTSDWQSSLIYRMPVVGTLYYPNMHGVSNQFDYALWKTGPPSDAIGAIPSQSTAKAISSLPPRAAESVKAMSAARQSALDAQIAYADETIAWKNMKIDLAAHGFDTALQYSPFSAIGIIANIVQAYNEVQSFHNYPLRWNALMSKTISTVNNASIAVNGAFLSAQEQADTLHIMGADDPSYHGAAAEVWQEWASFVTEANAWSIAPNPADLNTTGGRYAKTYRVLRHVEYLCNNPADPMQFDNSGPVWVTVNDMLSNDDNSLWAQAWALQSRLQTAANRMEWELQDNETAANSQIEKASGAIKALEEAEWNDDLSEAQLVDYNYSAQAQAAPYAGTFNSLLMQSSDALERAETARDSADYAGAQTGRAGYAVRAMSLYAKASAEAADSYKTAKSLLSDITSRTDTARTLAQSAVNSLSASVDAQPGGLSGAQAASLNDARNSLEKAKTEFLAGERSTKLGERMPHYLAALSSARLGERLLNRSSSASSDLFEMRRLLENYKKLMELAPGLGVDVSNYEPAYFEYLAEVNQSNPNPKPGSADALKIQIASLRHDLLGALSSESDSYDLLLAQSEALPYRTHAVDTLRAEMGKWREAAGWNDEALAHPEQLRTQLAASQNRIHALIGQTISEDICSPELATWAPYNLLNPIAGQRQQVGGVWKSRNPLPLDYGEQLTIDCPFDVTFYTSEKPALGGPVQKAWANNGQLHLVLNPLQASEEISVNFSAMQEPFHLVQTGCMLNVDENHAVLRANYTLKSDYYSPSVAVNIPWESSAQPLSARMQAQGIWTDGVYLFNSPDSNSISTAGWQLSPAYAHFLLSDLPAPTAQSSAPAPLNFTVELRPADAPSLERQSVQVSPLDGGMVRVSYTLTADNLPACSSAQVLITETSDPISNLSVTSSDGRAQIVQSPIAGSPQWSVLVTNRQASGRIALSVNYIASDPAQWVNLSLPLLQAAAAERNDAAALSLAAQARSQADAADWPAAMQTLEKLRSYLDKLPASVVIDSSGPDALAWNQTSVRAGSLLFDLASFSSNLRISSSRPAWALDLLAWRNELNTSLRSNSDLAEKGSYKSAMAALDSKAAAIRLKMLDEAGKDLEVLNTMYNSFMAAASGDTDRQFLDQAGRRLLDARDAIGNEDGYGALLALLDARSSLELYKSSWNSQVEQWAARQDAQVSSITSDAETAQSDLQAYGASISQLDSSKMQPLLKTAEVPAWQKKLQNISSISLAAQIPKDDPVKTKLALSKRDASITSARSTLQTLRQALNQSYKSLAGGANAQYERALSYVQDVRSNPALANSPKGQKLEEDLAQLQEIMNSGRWADAINQAALVTAAAQGLLQTAPRSGAELPLPLIGATILLGGGIVYTLLSRRKNPRIQQAGAGSAAPFPSSPAPDAHEGKKLQRQE